MTKITDDMIDKAQLAYSRRPDGSFRTPYPNADDVRRMLEAALSPEPEIPVSEGMLIAGRRAFHIADDYPNVGPDAWKKIYAATYRAMESARRKENLNPAERRSGKDRRVNPWDAWWQCTGPTPWSVRGDEGRGQNRGRRKTDQ